MNNDIEEALHECQAYAQKGYETKAEASKDILRPSKQA